MASLLQGFEEVQLVKPVGKTVLTVTIKFSKPEGKQAASVSVKEATLIEAVKAYFTLPETPEGEIAYQSVNGTAYPESKTVIFDVANATAGTMKRRGRKKAA